MKKLFLRFIYVAEKSSNFDGEIYTKHTRYYHKYMLTPFNDI